MTQRILSGSILILCTIAFFGSCANEASTPETTEAAGCRARVIAGVIRRDDATRADIRRTRDTGLSPTAGESMRLVVTKSCYRLDVRVGDEILKTYPIALGGNPEGTKTRQGDGKTPEGRYTLTPHHPSPSFGGSFYISYPNRLDATRGRAAGLLTEAQANRIERDLAAGKLPPHDTPLGGLILLHGRKNRAQPLPLTANNWTDGCIAMENDDLLELLHVFDRTDRLTLEILP